MPQTASIAEQLCLACGLCCNGVIFADVQLQRGDDVAGLDLAGLPLSKNKTGKTKFPQPCAAWKNCRCQIYTMRPRHCRDFECALLESVHGGWTTVDSALRTIRTAKRQADKVRELLRQLGDADEQMALSLRFRRVKKRMESSDLDEETADIFGQLTLAVHELNVLLSEAFYPGAQET